MADDSYGPDSSSFTAQSAAEAVKKMQEFAGLPQTGVLDSQTKKVIKTAEKDSQYS